MKFQSMNSLYWRNIRAKLFFFFPLGLWLSDQKICHFFRIRTCIKKKKKKTVAQIRKITKIQSDNRRYFICSFIFPVLVPNHVRFSFLVELFLVDNLKKCLIKSIEVSFLSLNDTSWLGGQTPVNCFNVHKHVH